MTITLNCTFYKNNTKKQGIVRREFLKGGTLSIDRIIEERAPPSPAAMYIATTLPFVAAALTD